MKTVLEIIWDGLETRNVPSLLIGGHALAAFGVAREELKSTCARYGPEGIYTKLESYL